MPNAGWPERSGGRMLYPASPDYFAEYALALRLAGASILGGCCGTTPAHCAAMRGALHQGTPAQVTLLDLPGPPSLDATPFEGPTRLQSRLRDDRFTISVELDPPREILDPEDPGGSHVARRKWGRRADRRRQSDGPTAHEPLGHLSPGAAGDRAGLRAPFSDAWPEPAPHSGRSAGGSCPGNPQLAGRHGRSNNAGGFRPAQATARTSCPPAWCA